MTKMKTTSSRVAALTLFCLCNSLIPNVMAEYCEPGLCSTKEYCCGDNECCTAFNTWLLIGCLLLALVILSFAAACIYRYYCSNSSLRRSNSRSRLMT